MADAKIEIKVGAVSFSGEGDGKWLSEQLDKVLDRIPELANFSPEEPAAEGRSDGTGFVASAQRSAKIKVPLASFLKGKKNTSNQVRKFLATAAWLHDHDSKEYLSTQDVTKAISENKQGPALTNPSDCLAGNISKGYCAKGPNKKVFYVTEEGRAYLNQLAKADE